MNGFFYVTVRDVPGFSPGYLGHDLDGEVVLTKTTPALFPGYGLAHLQAYKFTKRHGGTFLVRELVLIRP